MENPGLFDFNYLLDIPGNEKFPLNLKNQGRTVREIVLRDIRDSKEYLIITGFTSLSNLIDIFGANDYSNLKKTRIVIGFDPEERVGKALPHYSLPVEIRNYWLKQNVSIRLCGSILNVIGKIERGEIEFRTKDRLHGKLYVGDEAAILGSSNFSKSGLMYQTEANIRIKSTEGETQKEQYKDIKRVAEYYYSISIDYNTELIDLLKKLLKDATWEEALARAIAEIIESKWMKDYPSLYQALISHELWPSQKIGIAGAMKIIQDQGRVLLADPTGSGKTKFATALAYTLFHWLWENGLKEKSNALIISPRQVVENWEKEQSYFKLYNKIESMGKLSLGHVKNQAQLTKQIETSDILVVDEAHNYLHPGTKRSQAINPLGSAYVILSTATPINKKAEDLLRLIEILDIDNLSDEDLTKFLELKKTRGKKGIDSEYIERLKSFVNQFIIRRTKKDLNRMIDKEPMMYKNRLGQPCRYPKAISTTYKTGETENDKAIAQRILALSDKLKGIHNLQTIKIPTYLILEEERRNYVKQRFTSAHALAAHMVRAALRSSSCALVEYLHGTLAANQKYGLTSTKNPSGKIIEKIEKFKIKVPKKHIEDGWLLPEHQWLYNPEAYTQACEEEIKIYNEISDLVNGLSGKRELSKANQLIERANTYQKVLGFDSTVITLDYLKKLIDDQNQEINTIVATGQNAHSKNKVKEYFGLESNQQSRIIALCSDAMSEGINLQDARALVLLDMPSVLRLIEQRIGRLERMDSIHNEINVYWPDDSKPFSLNGDKRIVEILIVTEALIKNNVDIPKDLYEKHLKEGMSTKNLIQAYEEYESEENEWAGVRDSTQCLYDLKDGKNALINNKLYEEFKDVDATVKSAVSFVEDNKEWCFFCFRGSTKRSPKWLLIDKQNKPHTDFAVISDLLKEYLAKGNIVQRTWKEIELKTETNKVLLKLRKQEFGLLPWKKKRALGVGEKLTLAFKKQNEKDSSLTEKANKVLELFKSDATDNAMVDLDHFADLWLSMLYPALDKMRQTKFRKRKIFTLRDIKLSHIEISETKLDWLMENCQYSSKLEEIIASCIIGITKLKEKS